MPGAQFIFVLGGNLFIFVGNLFVFLENLSQLLELLTNLTQPKRFASYKPAKLIGSQLMAQPPSPQPPNRNFGAWRPPQPQPPSPRLLQPQTNRKF